MNTAVNSGREMKGLCGALNRRDDRHLVTTIISLRDCKSCSGKTPDIGRCGSTPRNIEVTPITVTVNGVHPMRPIERTSANPIKRSPTDHISTLFMPKNTRRAHVSPSDLSYLAFCPPRINCGRVTND